MKIYCPYCGKPARWVENKEIYGRNYGKSYMCWLCKDCDAYVGCHQNTKEPLGTVANRELRKWRKEAHSVFDLLWKKYDYKRKESYILLQTMMGLSPKKAHIGKFNIEQCKKLIKKINESN